jgi:hypothetical protein
MIPFSGITLEKEYENRKIVIESNIKSMTAQQINNIDNEIIIDDFYRKYSLVVVHLENSYFDSMMDEKEDNRAVTFSPFSINKENAFLILQDNTPNQKNVWFRPKYRFTGSDLLFQLSLNDSHQTIREEIGLEEKLIYFYFEATVNELKENKSIFNQKSELLLNRIQKKLTDINKEVVEQNNKLKDFIRDCLQERKGETDLLDSLKKHYKIPIEVKDPEIIKVVKKIGMKVELTTQASKEENYAIDEVVYQDILEILRHHTRTMERLPMTFSKLNEYELRDILLASLNCVFKGEANGEAFRNNGKTDICIQEKNASAFVAELKFWKGRQGFDEALKQLFSYTIWRDNKLALVIFTKTTNISTVIKEVSSYLADYEYKLDLQKINESEYELISYSKIDNNRQMRTRIFVVDIKTINI